MPTIGTLTDQLGRLKEQHDAANALVKKAEEKVKKIAEKYNAKESELHQAMKDEGTELGSGRLYKGSVQKTVHPSVKDWNKLYAYIARTKSWDLLQRRMSSTAYRARLEDGKRVAGVESFTKLRIKLTKK